ADTPRPAPCDGPDPKRPPDVVFRVPPPAREVRRRAVRPRLEEEDAPATVGELTGDDAAARARAHHDDVETFGRAHEIPRYDQSFWRRGARGGLKSISSP